MILIGFSVGALLLISLPIVAKCLAATQEIYPPVKQAALRDFSAQAIVVLGGGLRRPAPEYTGQVTLKNRTLARVRYAALLARQTHLPLLVSGGKVFKTSVSSEAVVMAAVLNNEYQLPVRWQEPTSRNTAENAIYTHKICGESLFLRKLVLGIPAQASGKNLTRLLCLRRPDSSSSPRPDPTGGRNIGSK